jgi:hypothetical protein
MRGNGCPRFAVTTWVRSGQARRSAATALEEFTSNLNPLVQF